ncbi:MAG: DUF1648 domain-containing protein [Gemmatimonadetes bacterium]|nr:DUF1648 domain-containing protein [Gemmatimonadota bacterium]NNM05917.1 DUF1648 domain-containing protein [Gemmatimonadota bacterium]
MKAFFDRLNAILMTGLVGFAVWAWPRLPDQVPTHFALDGQPDSWAQ